MRFNRPTLRCRVMARSIPLGFRTGFEIRMRFASMISRQMAVVRSPMVSTAS